MTRLALVLVGLVLTAGYVLGTVAASAAAEWWTATGIGG